MMCVSAPSARQKMQTGRATVYSQLLLDSIGLVGIGTVILLIGAQLIDTSRIHVSLLSFNDQVGYIATARGLVDTGVATGHLIFPSMLFQNASKSYSYMPGHYYALALFYRLFGYGVWQSLLPNLLSLLLTVVCTYLIAVRWFRRGTALLAALIVLLFPAHLVYAFSAMSELTRLAVTTLALCVFVYLPTRRQPWLGPLLIVPAFLFRETGALLLLPMGLFILFATPRLNWRPAVLFAVLSVVLVGLTFISPLAAGRQSLVPSFVFDRSYTTMYTDALAVQAQGTRSWLSWGYALLIKFVGNIFSIGKNFISEGTSFLMLSLAAIFVGTGIATESGFKHKNLFFLASALFALGNLLFIMFLQDDLGYGWLRGLLVCAPYLAIVAAEVFRRTAHRFTGSLGTTIRYSVYAVAVAAITLIGLYGLAAFFQPAGATDQVDDRRTALMESLEPDTRGLLVSSENYLDFVQVHYPVRWSFVPANKPTFQALAAKYDISTVVLMEGELYDMSDADFARQGLALARTAEYENLKWLVYKKTKP